MIRPVPLWLALATVGLVLPGLSCSPGGPQVGSQTNWMGSCESSDECGDLECLCGVCTTTCSADGECSSFSGASCVPAEDPGTIALCGGSASPAPLCLPRCDGPCSAGSICVAGVCTPDGAPRIEVNVDAGARFQTLVGFGAGLGYVEDEIDSHPDRAQLYDALFIDAGLDALRIRNRYDGISEPDVSVTRAIVEAVTDRLGRAPLILFNSSSPPASLKANGSRFCSGNFDTCTLAQLGDGTFDYEGFAAYLRTSVDAYVAAGIPLDYLGIQNHPNLVPASDAPGEGCRFLPQEGTESMTLDGEEVEVPIAGYQEALAAVRTALSGAPGAPRFGVADGTGLGSVHDYVPELEADVFDAIVFHLYGVDPAAIDLTPFEAVRTLSEQTGRPAIQSEFSAPARETAMLIHHSMVSAGASGYLQHGLVATSVDAADTSLSLLTENSFERLLLLDVFAHFARHTDPGWVRVDAVSSSTELLASAWLSPEETALTLVLLNPTATDLSTVVTVPQSLESARSEVTRTVFDGLERSALLGALPATGEVRLPAGSIVTIAVTSE